MGLPCYNSIAADEYAYQQGKEAEREIWEEEKRAEIEQRLNEGGSVCIGYANYTRPEILNENLTELGDMITLNSWLVTGCESDAILFRERCEEIISTWINQHLDDILATEYGYVAEDAA